MFGNTTGTAAAAVLIAFASWPLAAQEAAPEHKAFRAAQGKLLEKVRASASEAARRVDASPPVTRSSGPRVNERRRSSVDTGRHAKSTEAHSLSELGATAPFCYSARGTILVAALSDGSGLAVWNTPQQKQLRQLEQSDEGYALLAISSDARWIAGIPRGDSDRIDVWRADTGRRVSSIDAPGGRKLKLEFVAGGQQLSVWSASGEATVYDLPRGNSAPATDTAKNFHQRSLLPRDSSPGSAAESPPQARPSAPQAKPPAPKSAPPARPMMSPRGPAAEPESEPPVASQAPSSSAPYRVEAPKVGELGGGEGSAPSYDAQLRSRAMQAEVEPDAESEAEPDGSMADEESSQPGAAAPAGEAWPQMAAPTEEAPATEAPAAEAWPQMSAPAEESDALSSDPSGGSVSPMMGPTETGPVEPPAASFHPEVEETVPTATSRARVAPPTAAPTAQAKTPEVTSVNIHFATNRNRLIPVDRVWSVYFSGFFVSLPAFVIYAAIVLAMLVFPWFGKRTWAASVAVLGIASLFAMATLEAYVRSQLRDELSGELYGCRPTDISYGKCTISVPLPQNRQAGELSRPVSVWIFEAPENPEKHFMLRDVKEHAGKDEFYGSLAGQLSLSETGAALLFIHGYNVSFEDAIFRTAQLAVDLKFPGAAISFCWPSYADPVKYTFDEQHAEVSVPALREVMQDLATRSGAKHIHVIAHSMGNRVLAGALRSMDPSLQERNKEVFRELVLAAPDIDSRVFQTQVLPYIARNVQHCTLYASARDRALLMSRAFHNFQRLGETQPELLVSDGIDTIDATLVDTSLLGHSYIGDAQSIVADLHNLVVSGKRPLERPGLQTLQQNALHYWSIKPELQATSGSLTR